MTEHSAVFCEVSLPVPLDRAFTYEIPAPLRHRLQAGCRVMVPFGPKKLAGVVLRVHGDKPEIQTRQVLRLLDEEPAIDAQMLRLAQWISAYYCAPLGEVLRGMTPLAAEVRQTKTCALTSAGRDAARQLLIGTPGEAPAVQLLRLLDQRPLSAAYLERKVPRSKEALRSLVRRGFVELEVDSESRDPLRSPSSRLRAEFRRRPAEGKLTRSERELLSYLELHPGSHNLQDLEATVPHASTAARAMARRELIVLRPEAPSMFSGPARPDHTLNVHQQLAYERVRGCVEAGRFHAFLLHGVTGSGKTEVYLRLIDCCLELNRGALMLVPEIGLTPAVAGQFYQRFGDRVAILHSAFTGTERAEQWRRIHRGEAGVVVGTRSSVFAPVRNLGLVIVDEEHDHSYKQEETPRYNGRDVAVVRARDAGAAVVLGSATPSLESGHNAETGKYTMLELPERIEQRPLPRVELIDMRQEFLETRKQSTFSRALLAAIRERLEAGEQTMVLLNRRGFSSFACCRACGERVQCRDCAVTLTWHRRDRRMLCHYCGYAERVPERCPKCDSEYIQFLGVGSERVEDELGREFPKARVARMDRDTVSRRQHFETILRDFRDGRYDILVGTQMIAKGHDIPSVTLVGIINADIGLGLPDFRSAERTFQLLTQAAGRAGRGETPGMVLLQTINPEHYAVRYAAAQDYARFYVKEIEFRRLMRYPPYSALANLLIRSQSAEEALRLSSELGQHLGAQAEGLRVMGPGAAPVPKLKREFRYQLLLKAASRKRLNEALQTSRRFAAGRNWPATALVIDVDPLSLL